MILLMSERFFMFSAVIAFWTSTKLNVFGTYVACSKFSKPLTNSCLAWHRARITLINTLFDISKLFSSSFFFQITHEICFYIKFFKILYQTSATQSTIFHRLPLIEMIKILQPWFHISKGKIQI